MPNFRHVITDCIQSGRTGNRPNLHVAEAEQAYLDAMDKLKSVHDDLEEYESLHEKRSRYLKKLVHDEITAKLEVPDLKKELLSLKEKLISLTFETERWDEACLKQEAHIAELETQKENLTNALNSLENERLATEENNILFSSEINELSNNIENINDVRSKIDQFEMIAPSQEPSEQSKGLSSAELVTDINSLVAQIHSDQSAKQQSQSIITATTESIKNKDDSIADVKNRLSKLEDLSRQKKEIISVFDNDISLLTNQVTDLRERYQTYYEIIKESNEITAKRNELIETVNNENTALKDSLLNCNKLEMILRLEALKMNVFLKETEHLHE